MTESSTGRRIARVQPGDRVAVLLAIFAVTAVVSFLVLPAVAPDYALAGKYATGLVGFTAWMAWFVDWLAVRLGQQTHPSQRDGE